MLGAAPDRPAARRRPHHHQGLPRGSDTAQASIDRNHANDYNRMIENEMAIVSRMTEAAPWFDERHGPLHLARYALIVVLALAMGLQNAVARRLGVPDLTTTVLTLTRTGLAADSTLAGGKGPAPGRRLLAMAAMFLGAAIGALLIFRVAVGAVLALALALLVVNGIAGHRLSSSTQAWTAGG